MEHSGLPGKRVEAYLAGIIMATCSDFKDTFAFLTGLLKHSILEHLGCTTQREAVKMSKHQAYSLLKMC
jgi:hypothetical protein